MSYKPDPITRPEIQIDYIAVRLDEIAKELKEIKTLLQQQNQKEGSAENAES